MRTFLAILLTMVFSAASFSQIDSTKIWEEEIENADRYHKLGGEAYTDNNYLKAVAYYDSAQKVRENLLVKADYLPSVARNRLLTGCIKSLHNAGVSYYYFGALDKAEEFTQKSIDIQHDFNKRFGFIIPLRLGRSYCQLGKVYLKTSGFDKTYDQLTLSRHYLNQADFLPTGDLNLLENTLSNLFLLWEEADSLIAHSRGQLSIHSLYGEGDPPPTALLNLGVGLEWKGDLSLALDSYSECLRICRKDPDRNLELISDIFRNRSYVYAKTSNWQEAIYSVDKAIAINDSLEESIITIKDRAELLLTKGYIHYLQGNFERAIQVYEEALNVLNLTFAQTLEGERLDRVGEEKDFWAIDPISPLYALGYQAKAFASAKKHKEAQSAFTLAINYLNKIRREYNDTESKLKLTEIAKVIFEGAIALHLDPAVNEPEKAFAYAEQSKAFTLLEGIKHSKAMHIAKVPEELLEREYELRGKIARLERKYLAAEEPEEKTEHLQAIRQHKEELTGLLNRLQRNKEYRKLMSFEAPRSRQLQRKALGVGQTLVEYFVGEEKTYVFVLPKKGKLKVLQLDLESKKLNQQVDEFWSSIYHYGCDEEVLRQEAPELLAMGEEARKERLQAKYLALGQSLYTQLFQPIVDLGVGTRFVIVPDEGLSYLPFDALLVGAPEIQNFSFYPYLGREFTLSYAYSGNLLLEVQQGRGSKARKILAMAPSFSSRQLAMNKSALSRLTNNVTEINAICDIFSGQCSPLEGMAANLESFRRLVEQNAYRIIHLSTHGKANDKNPNQSWISFTQNREQLDESQLLYASDLYALPIQADLVVLSACETNKGRLRRGEGIMSFARGFSAAGVKSVLSTFWVIGEDPSLLVMKDFYEQLNEGAAKDEALQKARLGLMENSDFSHPFYWSAFVPIGQMAEVEAGGSGRWLVGVFLVLLAFWIFRHQKSRSLLMSEN